MPAPGLIATDQAPASTLATVALDATRTITDIWRRLFDVHGVRDAFIRAIRAFATGLTVPDLYDELAAREVPYWLRSRIRDVALGDRREAWHLAADVVPGLGSGQSTVDDLLATARLFEALAEPGPDDDGDARDHAPTIAVIVERGFRERRRDQRVDICRLLAVLARAFDIRLVATHLTRAWLAREHRADLPGVSEWCTAPPIEAPASAIDDALAALDPDGREVALLRTLADEPSATLSYHQLYADAQVSRARVRQVVARLTDLGLVEPFGSAADRQVDLLAAGRDVVETLDAEIGRQRRLDDCVSATGNSHTQAVLPRAREEGEREGAQPYRTAYLGRAVHAAAAACGRAGGVCLAEQPASDAETTTDDHVRYVSYDADRDEAVVSVRATGALQYAVSTATALASPRFLDQALPPERLDGIGDREPPAILRDARCIGALSDDALADPSDLRDALVEWGQEIEELTTDLRNGEYDDRDRFRSAILRTSHGLAGSIVHLLDVVGVDVVREVVVPAGLDRDHLDELARSLAVSAGIQSRYGAFASYRQLFETDAGRPPLSPTVDATDPVGALIGGFVCRGPDIDRLQPSLERFLNAPAERCDDAPEFAVPVRIRYAGRSEYAEAVTRILSTKDLRPTREAISMLHALAPSPYDGARAVQQLAGDDQPRDLRPDDVRYALSTLGAEALLPNLPPTIGKIVTALLEAREPLSQADLADAAGISTRSIRSHRDRLEALDLLRVDAGGWRLALSFPAGNERRDDVLPAFVADDSLFIDVVDALLLRELPAERYGDPEDPIGGVLFWPPDPWRLVDDPEAVDLHLAPWVVLGARLTGTDRPKTDRVSMASIGPTIEQTPITVV